MAKRHNQAADERDDKAAELAELVPAPRRESATVPAGYVLVDVVLPAHRAFVARKWADAARTRLAELQRIAQEAAAKADEERRKASRTLVDNARKKAGESDGRVELRMRYRVTRVHHPCFSRDIGKVVIVDRFAGRGMVWAHDDKPITYRANRNGRRVVDFDPSCVQSLYNVDDLEPAEGGRGSKIE